MDYSKLNNIAASIQDVENAASIVENRLNTKIDEDIQSIQDAISDIGNNPSSEPIDDNVISVALNDLNDKTDNLNKDVENLERVTSSSLNDLNIKVEEQEKVTSSSLNDLNEKVDNLDNNESIIASSLNDLNDKVDDLKDNESVISSLLNDLNDRLKVIRETDDKIEFVGKKVIQKTNITAQLRNLNSSDLDDFTNSYVNAYKSLYGNDFTPEIEESIISGIRLMPEEEFDSIKVYENNLLNLSDSISDYLEIKLYKEENGEELNYHFEVIPSHSKLFLFIPGYTSNSVFIENLPYYSNNSELPIATLEKETGDFYIEGLSNSLQKTIKDNELATASALTDLEGNLQNLNLDFKNNLKIDNEGNLVVHEIGTAEKEIHGSSGFHLSNDYFKIYNALTYDPNSSVTTLFEGYTQESMRQLMIERNLINPNYYYYVVWDENTGSARLDDNYFYNLDNPVGFSKFISIDINDTDVEFSDYIEKFNSDGNIAYIVIALETEFTGDFSNVFLTYENYPIFDKYISKINLDNGKLYLLGMGNYTAKDPSYDGVLSILEVIASLISRIETLEAQISGGNS